MDIGVIGLQWIITMDRITFLKKQGLRLSICFYWKNYIFYEKIS